MAHVHVGARPLEIYLQSGAVVSVVSCATVLLSYLRRRRWRRHPNPLLFWKSVIDMVYALRFLFVWDEVVGPLGCLALAALTQFCMIASECWFVSMALDLYRSSTNPFANVRASMRWYHIFAWGLGALFAALLWLSGIHFDMDQDPFCFVTEHDTALQMLYYLVVAASVLGAVTLSVLENRAYPHGGMKEARQAKKDVIRSARVFTTAYSIYQSVLISLWIADMIAFHLEATNLNDIRNMTFFLQASKGLIDLVIWVAMNGKDLRGWPSPAASAELSITESASDSNREDQFSDIDIDLEPQLNVELRKEVLHFTTRGVVAASANARRVSASRQVVRLRLHELGMVVAFTDYHPAVFREIRQGFGIEEVAYRKSFIATCHERIQSGGSSGAFMFFTADYMYLVKTVTVTERGVLLRMLPQYVEHMRANPGSHLTRYYGCHSIGMYGQVFSFVVMGNVIGRVSMHQFYDIKGSWINRNAKPIPPGKTVICTYCSNAFRYGSTAHCEYSTHGTHLPHMVLKDNDFHRKLRVLPETAEEIVSQLDRDTAFLRSQGITDYSLLLSIHSTKYVVDHASMDIATEAIERTRRRYNHAVCHPEGRVHRESSTSDLGMRVNVEIVDGTDSCSSEDEDEGDSFPSDIQVTSPTTSDRPGMLSRNFRYSVLNAESDGSVTPLLPRASLAQYGSSSPVPHVPGPNVVPDPGEGWIGTRAPEKTGYQAYAVVGPDYYTIGVVDILQTWTLRKRLERFWKVWILRQDPNGISAAPPGRYAARFRRKVREIMMMPNDDVGFGNL